MFNKLAMIQAFLREVFYYKDYYLKFFKTLNPDTQKKFNWTLQLISTLERVPIKYFKHLTGTSGIFEIRVEQGSNIYRVFSFFEKGNLVILMNGFQKKTQKTDKKEIELAERLKKQYFDEKS